MCTVKEFVYRGHNCSVKVNKIGYLCGYTDLMNPAHPLLVKYYMETYLYGYSSIFLAVHGGVTYVQDTTIGFDCAHFGDAPNPDFFDEETWNYYKRHPDGLEPKGHAWTLEEVEDEIKGMVDQILEQKFYTKSDLLQPFRDLWRMLQCNFKTVWKEGY